MARSRPLYSRTRLPRLPPRGGLSGIRRQLMQIRGSPSVLGPAIRRRSGARQRSVTRSSGTPTARRARVYGVPPVVSQEDRQERNRRLMGLAEQGVLPIPPTRVPELREMCLDYLAAVLEGIDFVHGPGQPDESPQVDLGESESEHSDSSTGTTSASPTSPESIDTTPLPDAASATVVGSTRAIALAARASSAMSASSVLPPGVSTTTIVLPPIIRRQNSFYTTPWHAGTDRAPADTEWF